MIKDLFQRFFLFGLAGICLLIGGITLYGATRVSHNGSASRIPTGGDRWITDSVCRAPCWEEIIPGQTSLSEALDRLKELPFVASLPVKLGMGQEESPYGSWRGSDGFAGGTFGYVPADPATARIKNLQVNGNSGVRLEMVIAAYGEPEAIKAIAISPRHPTDWTKYDLSIAFPAHGLILETGSLYPIQPALSGASVFDEFTFSSAEDVQATVQDPLYRPWEGWKSFQYYCQVENPQRSPCEPPSFTIQALSYSFLGIGTILLIYAVVLRIIHSRAK